MHALRLTSIAALVLAFAVVVHPMNSQAQNAQPKAAEETIAALRFKAEQGDANAQYSLGMKMCVSEEPDFNINEAIKWHRKAAEQGHREAQYFLGVTYEIGAGVPKDGPESVKWFTLAANQGHVKAQNSVGSCYLNGIGVAENAAEAVKWFLKAAQSGNMDAQNSLGDVYFYGRGVAKDGAEAVKWYLKAAEQGNPEAQYQLGLLYSEYQSVPDSQITAMKWYLKAAEQGHTAAQYNLGVMFYTGTGVAKDYLEALKWIRKAAGKGEYTQPYNLGENIEAQYALGRIYYYSGLSDAAGQIVVPKDPSEGVMWFRKAANRGHAAAQSELGIIYCEGYGVLKNEVEGYKWMLLSAAQGEEAAKKNIAIAERQMSAQQRAEGQRLAAMFKPTIVTSPHSPITREGIAESLPESTGSGFFITDDGYLITNQHVADEGAAVRVLTGNGAIPAKVVKVDLANDIALLKAEGKFSSLAIVASRGVRLGSTAATVGFPNVGLQGYSPKLAKGEIASLAGIQDDARHFQISVPVQPGNSGGALVDERGNVIGVVVAKLSQKAAIATTGTLAENVSYAVKSSYLLSFLESVPEVAAKLKEPNTSERKFEDVIRDAEQAAVLVLVY